MAWIKDPFPLGIIDSSLFDVDHLKFKGVDAKTTTTGTPAISVDHSGMVDLDDDWCGTGKPILDLTGGLGGGFGGPIVNGEMGPDLWDIIG